MSLARMFARQSLTSEGDVTSDCSSLIETGRAGVVVAFRIAVD